MPLTKDLVTLLESEIRGYNQRPLAMEELEVICDQAGLVLVHSPFPGTGAYFRCKGLPVIAVDSRLNPEYAAFVGFHEFFHFRFHPGSIHTYDNTTYWLDKVELQASILASLAVIPTPFLVDTLISGDSLSRHSQLPEHVLELRLRVHQNYRNLLTARQGFDLVCSEQYS